jgi:hypothetical protein
MRAFYLPPRESGEGGPHEVRWEGRERRRTANVDVLATSYQATSYQPPPPPRYAWSPSPVFTGEDKFNRSRGVPLRPSYETPLSRNSQTRHHRALTRWSMLSCGKRAPVESTAQTSLPHGLPGIDERSDVVLRSALSGNDEGKNERKISEAKRRQTQLIILPCLRDTAAPQA